MQAIAKLEICTVRIDCTTAH